MEFITAIPIVWGCIALFGIIANLAVIFLIIRRKLVHRAVNCYVLNLAITDVVFLLICPVIATVPMINPAWSLGRFACQALNFLSIWSVHANCWTLVIMTSDRCIRVISDSITSIRRSKTEIGIRFLLIWTVSFLLAVPTIHLYDLHSVSTQIANTTNTNDNQSLTGITKMQFCALSTVKVPYIRIILISSVINHYVLPVFLIAVCYILICCKLNQQHKRSRASLQKHCIGAKNRANRLISAIFFTFAFCWLPNSLYVICVGIFYQRTFYHYNTAIYFKVVSHTLTYLNSCLNPLYNVVLNRNLWSELKRKPNKQC